MGGFLANWETNCLHRVRKVAHLDLDIRVRWFLFVMNSQKNIDDAFQYGKKVSRGNNEAKNEADGKKSEIGYDRILFVAYPVKHSVCQKNSAWKPKI